jgi:hypothetical protein
VVLHTQYPARVTTYYYRLFEDFCDIIQLEYDKLLTQKECLQDHQYRLMIVPEAPETPNYSNNSTYTVPTRDASTSTHEEYDSDVSQKAEKGLRAILARFSTSSDKDESDASPKYSPTAQSDSSGSGRL